VAKGRRRLIDSTCKRNVARAISLACQYPAVNEIILRRDALATGLLNLATSEDGGLAVHGAAAVAVVCTSEERCTRMLAVDGGRLLPLLVDRISKAADGDALAIRWLVCLQNLCVLPATREICAQSNAPAAVVGVLDRLRHPLILFPAVVCTRYLIGDGEGRGISALVDAHVIESLAVLARGEKGIPEPDKVTAREESPDGAAPSASEEEVVQPEQQQQQQKDMRVALESTRVLCKLIVYRPELRVPVLSQPGFIAALEMMLRSGFAVLVNEVVRALRAVQADDGDKQKEAKLFVFEHRSVLCQALLESQSPDAASLASTISNGQ
jgi:hypothetical protein